MPQVEWTDAPPASGGNIVRLKMAGGNSYTVRFVGKPNKYDKYFHNGKSAITDAGKDCVVKTKWNLEPDTKWAINLIDRADAKLKVWDIPKSVYTTIAGWAEKKKVNPGEDAGTDWVIEVIGSGKLTKYRAYPDGGATPFTDDEQNMFKKQGLYKLDKLYAATPQKDIEAKLGLGVPAATVDPAKKGEVVQEEDIPF